MKKKLLTWSLCIALTATSVLAADAKISVKTATQKGIATSAPVMPQASMQVSPQNMHNLYGQPSAQLMQKDQMKKMIESRRSQEKNAMYKTLQLTEDQKTKAEAIDSKAKGEVLPIIKKLHVESKKLHDLKAKKANIFAIWKQRYIVNSIKNDLHRHITASRKDFKTILTKEQKVKFEQIEADRYKKMKEFKKHHKPGTHGPNGMGPVDGHNHYHMGPPPAPGMGPHRPELMGPPPEKDQ